MAGYDFAHGALATTSHAFAAGGVPGDIRIAVRFNPADPVATMVATIHETGHAMYEAGLPRDWRFQPVGAPRGGAVHESQSLIYEMQASRSSEFLGHLAPVMSEMLGGGWTPEAVLARYRRVAPGLIRIDADEVSYPLHVILRYRIEQALLSGELRRASFPPSGTG